MVLTQDHSIPKMGVFQLLNTIWEARQESVVQYTTAHHKLCFVETFFGLTKILAMVDTDVTHNYISSKKARGLRLKITNGNQSFKAGNSPTQKCVGDIHDALMRVGASLGTANLVAIEMQDFDLILGQEFIRKSCVVLAPHLGCIIFMDPRKPSMVSTIKLYYMNRIVSAISLCLVARNDCDELYMAMPLGEWDDEGEPESSNADFVQDVIDSYADVLPKRLPKEISSQRHVDHKIDLEEQAKPPTKAPYRLSGPEMQELKRRLKDLIKTSYLHPSRSPYAALVFFQWKKDDTLRLCVDYSALNKLTIKKKVSLAFDC